MLVNNIRQQTHQRSLLLGAAVVTRKKFKPTCNKLLKLSNDQLITPLVKQIWYIEANKTEHQHKTLL